MIVAVTGALVRLMAVKDSRSPVPAAGKPMETLSFVHVKIVLPTVPVKLTAFVAVELHTTWLAGWVTSGVGFTVIVKSLAAPIHPFANGATVISACTGVLTGLSAVNDGIFPLPLAVKPMAVLLLIQLKLLPLTAPVKFTGLVGAVLHKTWLGG